MKRRGSFLEESVATLFGKAGFATKLNTTKYGFEVDVLAYKEDYNIIIECKHYEDSHLVISSKLHEWASKGKKAGANKIILVVAGQTPKEKDYKLAKELGMYILDDEKIHYLNSLDGEELREQLNEIIQFDEKEYKKTIKKKDEDVKEIRILYLKKRATYGALLISISLIFLIMIVFGFKGLFINPKPHLILIFAGVIGLFISYKLHDYFSLKKLKSSTIFKTIDIIGKTKKLREHEKYGHEKEMREIINEAMELINFYKLTKRASQINIGIIMVLIILFILSIIL